MIKYELRIVSNTPTTYKTESQLTRQCLPAGVDENYFDKLVRFGFACFVAGMVGKWIMSSFNR